MEMKRNLLLLIGLCMAVCVQAQKKNFSYKFYGQVRGDLFYNSRANAEIVDGLFHLYPKDVALDADGKDLNASPNGSFYLLYSRLGIDVQGPKVGSAKTSLKLEADFRGSGSNWAVLRIRHAYVNLDWGKSAVLIGQTWHPLFGEVFPQMLNLSTGAPFQPFNRSPQIRYRYTDNGWQLTGSVLWQLQYLSAGPNGKSEEYIKNSCVPEVYLGVDYKKPGWQVGAGMEILSLVPRTQNEVDGKIYKVSERVTSVSGEAHVKYQDANWLVMAKTLLASNLTQTCMLGWLRRHLYRPTYRRTGIFTVSFLYFLVEYRVRKEMETGFVLRLFEELGSERGTGRQNLWRRSGRRSGIYDQPAAFV